VYAPPAYTNYENGTEYSETSKHKIQTPVSLFHLHRQAPPTKIKQSVTKRWHKIQAPGNHPKQRMQQILPCATASNFTTTKNLPFFYPKIVGNQFLRNTVAPVPKYTSPHAVRSNLKSCRSENHVFPKYE
jgi:hypothetical protein